MPAQLTTTSRILLFISVILAACLFGCGRNTSSIEGKVVDGKGRPLSGIRVIAVKTEAVEGHEGSRARTNSQGSFRLKGLISNSSYLIHSESDKWTAEAKVRVASGPKRTVGALPRHFVIRFVCLENKVIRDSLLGLEWVPASRQTMSWLDAVNYVANLSLAGGGWRLPSLSELRSIYDESLESHIDPAFGIDRDWVWSSQIKDDIEAWFFSFENRFEGGHCKDWPLTRGRVLAVRSPKQ